MQQLQILKNFPIGLECDLVKNDWRPVPLSEGVCDGGEVTMNDGKTFEVERSIRGTPIDLGCSVSKRWWTISCIC